MAGEGNFSNNDLDIKIGIEIDKVGAKDKLQSLVKELESINKINLKTKVKDNSSVIKNTTESVKKQKVQVLELGRGYKQISDKMKQMYADAAKGTTVDIKIDGANRKVDSFVAKVKKATGEIENLYYKYDADRKGYTLENKTYSNPTNTLRKTQLDELAVLKKEFDNKFAKMFNQYDSDIMNTSSITKGIDNIKTSLKSLSKLNYSEFTQQVKLIRKEFDALKISVDKLNNTKKSNKNAAAKLASNKAAQVKAAEAEAAKLKAAKDKEVDDEKKRLEKIENYRRDFNIKMQNLARTTSDVFYTPEMQSRLEELRQKLLSLNNVSLDKLESEFKNITLDVRKFTADVRDLNSSSTWIETIAKNTSKFFEWYVSANLTMQTKQALTDSIRKIMEMNEAMVELNKVTDMSDKALNSMKESAMGLSKQLGIESTEIMASMAEFGRITKDREEIVELARVASMASNVTTLTADEAASALNTTILSMKLNLSDAGMVLDQFNEIQNNYRE